MRIIATTTMWISFLKMIVEDADEAKMTKKSFKFLNDLAGAKETKTSYS